MSIICVYHSADTDGRVSAGIVKQKFPATEVEFVPANYNLDANLKLDQDTTLIIVDFSFSLEAMQDMEKIVKELIWIDHHPVIEEYKAAGFNPPGLRGLDESAAYYCWKYFFPDLPVPDYVRYTSDYDTWKHALPESHAFNAAMYNEKVYSINQYPWERLNNPEYVKILLKNGNKILEFSKLKRTVVKPHIFETMFQGYKTVAINMRNTNSTVFDGYETDADIMMTFGLYSNLDEARVTTYSKEGSVHVGELMKEFGGGGHAGAAGCVMPWARLPLCKKTDVKINFYLEPILNAVKADKYIADYYSSDNRRTFKSLNRMGNILGTSVCTVNHPLWMPITAYEDIVAWSFIGGQYLYRLYRYNSVSPIATAVLANVENLMEMPDGSLWWLDDSLLITV